MSATGGQASARSIAEATARKSYSKLVAYLAVQTRDVAAAEDALSDAFAKALSDWPKNGCPAHPEAWLLTVARRRAIDVARRQRRGAEINIQLQALAEQDSTQELEIPDRRLGLMFACTHPAIDRGIRAPLMLQVILGLNAATIASAFLVAPATMGQRLVRAKNKLRQAGVPFRVPGRKELPERLDTVLDAIYATYSEGWSDPVGTDLARRDLADEAVFLGTLLSELMPEEPEALGLLALMFHAEARRQARRTEKGEYVPLANQDPERWDKDLIEQAENILRQAGTIGKIGRFQLEAALQSAHVHRKITGTANWPAVLELYNALYELTHSPVVAVNRALAVAEVKGPLNALAILDELFESHRITEYQPYWAMRAELLTRIGDAEQASRAYEIAIGLERDPSVRDFLRKRQSAVTDAVLF
jgi:RNA polymerase sigma-70 factor (ECF subfamily)